MKLPVLLSLLASALFVVEGDSLFAQNKPSAASLPTTAAYHKANFQPGRAVTFQVSHTHTLLLDGRYCIIFYTYDPQSDVDGGTVLAWVTPAQESDLSSKYGTRRIRRKGSQGGKDLGVRTNMLRATLDQLTPDALFIRVP
jgi:hypothetical protein